MSLERKFLWFSLSQDVPQSAHVMKPLFGMLAVFFSVGMFNKDNLFGNLI